MITLYRWSGIFQPFLTIAVAVIATRGLTIWLGWLWYWQYIAAIVIWSTLNWAVELLLNSLGQRLQFSGD
ncbi:MAG TPA: hypothetical protein VHC39_04065 [Rhizomicrobium sp.]|nr:hypothetical protein [Rhizomicrobium sp.]